MVISYTSLPAPESGSPWRVGAQRLGYENGRFYLNHTSGRLLGPDGEADKDAVIFNLSDGRVAFMHRLHPNMQLALVRLLIKLWDRLAGTGIITCATFSVTRSSPRRRVRSVLGPAPAGEDDAEGFLLFYDERDGAGEYTTKVALLNAEYGPTSS